MFLIPIGHESDKVRRLPWISFLIMASCLIIHILVTIQINKAAVELESSTKKLVNYYLKHPYLELDPETKTLLFGEGNPEEIEEMLDIYRENASTYIHLFKEEEQEKLDQLSQNLKTSLNDLPHIKWGFIPAKKTYLGLVTYMFIHGGWFHLIGNLLFLFLTGPFIEDVWGRPIYTAFYLIVGMFSALMFAQHYPNFSGPLIGASGAIAGVMGAFLIRYLRTKIKFFFIFIFITGTFKAPAWLMLPLWLLLEIFNAKAIDAVNPSGGGVAHWVHVWGFIFGIVVAWGMKAFKIEEKYVHPKIEAQVHYVDEGYKAYEEALQKKSEGKLDEAYVLLTEVVKKDTSNKDAVEGLWDLGVQLGKENESSEFLIRLIETEIRHNQMDFALNHFFDLKAKIPKASISSTCKFMLMKKLTEQSDFKDAEDLANELLEDVDLNSSPGLLQNFVNTALELNPSIANRVIELCLKHPGIPEDEKAKLKTEFDKLQQKLQPTTAASGAEQVTAKAEDPLAVQPLTAEVEAQPEDKSIAPEVEGQLEVKPATAEFENKLAVEPATPNFEGQSEVKSAGEEVESQLAVEPAAEVESQLEGKSVEAEAEGPPPVQPLAADVEAQSEVKPVTTEVEGKLEDKSAEAKAEDPLEFQPATPNVEGQLGDKPVESEVEGELEVKSLTKEVEGQLEGKSAEVKAEDPLEFQPATPNVEGQLQDKPVAPEVEGQLEDKPAEAKAEGQLEVEPVTGNAEGQSDVKPAATEAEAESQLAVEPAAAKVEAQLEDKPVAPEFEGQLEVEPAVAEFEGQLEDKPAEAKAEGQLGIEPATPNAEAQSEVKPVATEVEGQLEGKLAEAKAEGPLAVQPLTANVEGQSEVKPVAPEIESQLEVEPATPNVEGRLEDKPAATEAEGEFEVKPLTKEAESQLGVEPVTADVEGQSDVKPAATEAEAESQLAVKPAATEAESKLAVEADESEKSLSTEKSIIAIKAIPLGIKEGKIALNTEELGEQLLPLNKVQLIAVAEISSDQEQPYMLIDLFLDDPKTNAPEIRAIRLFSTGFDPKKLFPSFQDHQDALKAFIAALLKLSGATPYPDEDTILFSAPQSFDSIEGYEKSILS